ncbi:MAG TPA: uroporphyrinogen-III synthase [Acidimicrobiales bacterium]|nr:uroporphyrinogen-III synthase [Acidimicrobiales bacterium]
MTGPLAGCRVAVLRSGGDGDAVRDALVERGADAATVVVAEVVDRPDDEVRAGVGELARFRWVAVTSKHAARRLELWAATWPPSTRIGAVGPATAAAVVGLGLDVAVVAAGGTARSLAASIDAGPVCFLAAARARADLAHELAARAIEVVAVVAYDVRTRDLDAHDGAVVGDADALVAMSPGAVDALCALRGPARAAALATPVIAIGPTTAAHAAEVRWPVAGTAASRTPAAVLDALAVVLSGRAIPGDRTRTSDGPTPHPT